MLRRASILVLAALLAACGGGGGGSSAPPVNGIGYDDATVYSSSPGASLPGAVEAAAVTQHTLALDGATLAYTATAGHLIARHPTTQAAQAAMFHVSYTLDGAPAATRPVTFFYNGGPGSATVWLKLGSFGPKRLATGVPQTTAARPFPLLDNADSLLDTTDLVFVNAVGTGRSQAIAPFTNRSFWGVDSDAALFRDFIVRWLEAHGRQASPTFLYGESYGGPRTAVLARLLQDAGVMLDGLVLQSPALDYNSNCAVEERPTSSCAGYLPSYAAVGAWHELTQPVPTDLDGWIDGARSFVATEYAPALAEYLDSATTAPDLWLPLSEWSGLEASQWQFRFNMGPTDYRQRLLPGELIGRYDGRMKAATGSALAVEGDPSSTWLTDSFRRANDAYLSDELGYRNASTYVMLGNAIASWDFSHDGRALPDTVPDLAAALAQNPALHVLAVSGLHDLATPFHVTETDLARLASDRMTIRNYPGGHMSFLDDDTRPRQKADLVAFYAATVRANAARPRPLAAAPRAPAADRAGTPQRPGEVPLVIEPAVQAPMRDPWVPPRR